MRKLLGIAFAALACVSQAQFTFYNGDPYTSLGWSCQHGGEIVDSRVYEDFTLGTLTRIDSLYGYFLDTSNNNGVNNIPIYWEIRKGVVGADYPNSGTGGTLVYGATFYGRRTDTGIRYDNYKVFRYEVFLMDYYFQPGVYWLTVAPELTGFTGGTWVATTMGTNRNGGYIADGLDTIDSTSWGYSWVRLGDEVSYGITGVPAPEPPSLAAVGIGALLLARRSHSRRVA